MKGSLTIYSRSASVEHWSAVLRRLVQDGKAYPCFCTDEELTQMKAQAEAESRPPIYTGRWAHASSEEVEQEKVLGVIGVQSADIDELPLRLNHEHRTQMLRQACPHRTRPAGRDREVS